MKRVLLSISFLLFFSFLYSQETLNIVVVGAHPDDCDLVAGRTALKM